MTFLLQAIPKPVLLAILAILLATLAGMGFQNHRLSSKLTEARFQLSETRGAWASERASLQEAARKAESNARVTEQTWNTILRDAQEKHDAEIFSVSRAASDSERAIRRLRNALKANPAPSGGDLPTQDPAPATVCAPAADVSELLLACAERYRVLGIAADTARSAGLQCERSYDALTSNPP